MEIFMYLIFFVIIFYQLFVTTQSSTIDMCDSSNSNNSFIYCSGEILTAVNLLGGLFNDSKHFVDMPLKADPAWTRAEFIRQFPNATQINSTDLRRFIDKYFSEPGSELTDCTPTDWQPNPPKLMAINDSRLRDWALRLHAIWKRLCKQIDPDVGIHPERYSLIHVPNHYIAPGGRYREFYYWDAYWIVKGLIASDMLETTRAMILNLAHMVDKYGFVPNGGRVYYLRRSQPPLLMPMLYEYYESTHDIEFVKSLLGTMECELKFWTTQRNIDVQIGSVNYTVYRYCTPTNVPRPESFREDVLNAPNTDESTKYWQNIASAAESGWDFSSRWFADQMTLQTIETTNILPIDLNAYICWNMGIFEYFYGLIGNIEKSDEFALQRTKLRHTIDAVFYNTTLGSWYDYNLRTRQHNTEFYLSMAVPLFAGCYENLSLQKSYRLFELMKNSGAFYYPGGVPTSLIRNTNEQWDFPNGWSPLNHMLIEGLRKSANAQMQQKAFDLAQKWVSSNYRVFMATDGHMWEKYDVSGTVPKPGAGGEYQVQDGFGWTNGVILDLLVTYNERLTVPSVPSSSSWSIRSRTELVVAVLLLLLMIV